MTYVNPNRIKITIENADGRVILSQDVIKEEIIHEQEEKSIDLWEYHPEVVLDELKLWFDQWQDSNNGLPWLFE